MVEYLKRVKKLLLIFAVIANAGFLLPKKITWVAVGDSITWLNEHSDAADHRITKGYLTLVKEKMPQLSYDNLGYSGWTSGNIADSIEKLPLKRADLYTVFLGTNDWWQGRPIGTLADYMHNTGNNTVYGSFRIIINKLRSLNNNARIILITPMQRGDFVWIKSGKNNAWGSYKEKNGQSLASFAEAINKIGEYEHLDVVDLYHKSGITLDKIVKYKRLKNPQTGDYQNYSYPDYIGIPFNPETDDYPYPPDAVDLTYDGLHPSDKGFTIIADMILKVLKKYY